MSDEEVSHGIALGTITVELYVDDEGEKVYRFDVEGIDHLLSLGLLDQVMSDIRNIGRDEY